MLKLGLIISTLAMAGIAMPAIAQAPSAAPALGGSAVAGVCLLSREAVFANAKVGVAATARLKELADRAKAEVDAQGKPLAADAQALQADAAKLTPQQRQAKEQELAPRLKAVQALAQQRNSELELTRQKALGQISDAAQPVIAAVYRAKNCGLLVNRDSVLGGNMTNDLTSDVVKGLDAKITTISFERATLPAGQQAANAQ
jgi:Skp family chaperone for outer membrane proteins